MDKVLNGKTIAEEIFNDLTKEVSSLIGEKKRSPRLEIFLVGDDYASIKYVEMKKKAAERIGIVCNLNKYDEGTDQPEIYNAISGMNKDINVDGIMVQLPLPKNYDKQFILNNISPKKDVDGLTALNLGELFMNNPASFISATPLGILKLLSRYNISVKGKNVVIIGKSLIVGIPLSAALLNLDASVTVLHENSKEIEKISSQADILVSATGQPLLITEKFVKEGAVVIDVGIAKHPETGKLVGDVDFDRVFSKVSYITPVPGGVGPMTVACLMSNVIKSWRSS